MADSDATPPASTAATRKTPTKKPTPKYVLSLWRFCVLERISEERERERERGRASARERGIEKTMQISCEAVTVVAKREGEREGGAELAPSLPAHRSFCCVCHKVEDIEVMTLKNS